MLKKLQKREEGFTLAELLIVVAIIAVLVAIAIPVFTGRLEQSRETTDISNLRSAYAAGQVAALSGIGTIPVQSLSGQTWYFDPNTSDGLVSGTPTSAVLGQGTAANGHAVTSTLPSGIVTYSNEVDVRGKAIEVTFGASGLSSVHFQN